MNSLLGFVALKSSACSVTVENLFWSLPKLLFINTDVDMVSTTQQIMPTIFKNLEKSRNIKPIMTVTVTF